MEFFFIIFYKKVDKAGLRIGEVCGLTWQDINLKEQYLTVNRSVRYDGTKHKTIIGPTKRKKVRAHTIPCTFYLNTVIVFQGLEELAYISLLPDRFLINSPLL